jgi:hypothetical protein
MTAQTPPTAKKAEAAIRFFEQNGRKVSGVTIKGAEYSIDFAAPPAQDIPEADFVNMSK